jgi:CHASE3 domain sensor protein
MPLRGLVAPGPRTSDEHEVWVRHASLVLGIGFGLIFLALAAAVFIAVRSAPVEQAIAHALEVRDTARLLLSDLQDAETGQRGFLLTSDPQYLQPFYAAESNIGPRFDGLAELTSSDPRQRERLNRIRAVAESKLDELRRTIGLAQQGRPDQAIEIIRSDLGIVLMNDIRTQLNEFTKAGLDVLAVREAAATQLRWWLIGLVCVSLLAAVGLIAFLTRAFRLAVGVARRRAAELESEANLRRETEHTLRQTQKIEAVGQLAGGIAHDFNNLLTIVLGNLDILQRRISDAHAGQDATELARTLAKPVEMALRGGRSAAQLTHRLLAFSRRQPLEPTLLDLNQVIARMSDLLRRTLGETVELESIAAGGLWPAFADNHQLESGLLNLCINARDAMPGGGRLTIETGNAYLDEAYARQFSEPFFTTKIAGEGSGLGLSMLHGFVKQSHGHIRIYSELGRGTTVKIYLPRHIGPVEIPAVPPAVPEDRISMPRARPQETILVVEDNQEVRDYARSVLEDLGYEVLASADAAQALQVLEGTRRVDLLFTDVVLPGASGRELADRAQQRRPGLPVLYTTGYTRNAIVHNGRLDPAVQLLTKPYVQQALARKVREMLDVSIC